MQHPDEGMIHTWLDGQLSADEAAKLETHLAECPQCAAKVAEERGLVAGATRILTALDNVPGDVIPINARPRRFSRGFLQAAAAILLVVTGGVIAVRVSGNDVRIPTVATVAPIDTQSAALPSTVVSVPSTAPTVARATATPESNAVHAPVPTRSVSKSPSANTAVVADARRAVEPLVKTPAATIAQGNKSFAPATVTGAVASAVVAPAPRSPVQKPRANDTTDVDIVLTRDQVQLQAVVTTGVASASPKLSVVSSEEFNGARVILLRTDAGRVARLTETPTPPAQVVSMAVPEATGANGIVGARGAVSSTRAVLSRTAATRTITWRDAKTGKFYSLTGEFSERELQEMRALIEADPALRK